MAIPESYNVRFCTVRPVLSDKMISRIEKSLSSLHRHWVFKDGVLPPCSRLIEFLNLYCPGTDKELWGDILNWGGVFLNGERMFQDAELPYPCIIEYYEPKYSVRNPDQFFPEFKKEYIVYEDEDLLLVYKPEGLPTHANREQVKCTLKNYLMEHAGCHVHIPSRLDVSTKGLVLTSKTERMHDKVQRLYAKRNIGKFYRLLTTGTVDWLSKAVNLPIDRDIRHPVLRKIVEEGGKPACTDFTVISKFEQDGESFVLLDAKPLTGRTHQIRVHSLYLGLPVVGDNFYGGLESKELHLVCYRLSFQHPITGSFLDIQLPEKLRPTWFGENR